VRNLSRVVAASTLSYLDMRFDPALEAQYEAYYRSWAANQWTRSYVVGTLAGAGAARGVAPPRHADDLASPLLARVVVVAGVALCGGISYEQGAAAVGGRTSWHIMSMLYMSMFLVHALAAFLMAAGWIRKSRLLSFHTALQVLSAFATVGTVIIESKYFVRRAAAGRARAPPPVLSLTGFSPVAGSAVPCQGRVYPPPTVFLSALLKFTNVCQHYLTVTSLFIAVAAASMLVTVVCTAGEVCASPRGPMHCDRHSYSDSLCCFGHPGANTADARIDGAAARLAGGVADVPRPRHLGRLVRLLCRTEYAAQLSKDLPRPGRGRQGRCGLTEAARSGAPS